MRPAILAVLVLMALPSGAAATATVRCDQRAEPGGPRPTAKEVRAARRSSVVLPYLTIWGLRRATSASFGPHHHRWKAGLSVRDYRAVTVRVATRDRGWLALRYEPEGGAAAAVRFVPCPPGTRRFSDGRPLGRETGWAGEFVVARAGCATLLVRRAGARRSTHVRAGFGVRCR
jgi:hypothetical protein